MRTIWFLVGALLISTPVYAQLPTDDCPTVGEFAATMAIARDQGIPQKMIEEVVLLGLKSLPPNDPQQAANMRLVAYVYERPHLRPPQIQTVITNACTNQAKKRRY